MKQNSELLAEAHSALHDKWFISGAVILYFTILQTIGNKLVDIIIKFFPLKGAMQATLVIVVVFIVVCQGLFNYGLANTFLEVKRGKDPRGSMLFSGYNSFIRVGLTWMLRDLYTYLWAILLIVPAIIKGYGYSMLPFIMHDNPDLGYDKAITRSSEMMRGHKMQLFMLDLSFIGWFFLAIIPFGLGLFAFIPYFLTARATFYENLKQETETTDVTPENYGI